MKAHYRASWLLGSTATRILYWNQSFLPFTGGAEIFTARLASGLVARGHEAMVITTRLPRNLPEIDEIDGVSVRRFAFLDALAPNGLDPRAKLLQIKEITSRVAEVKREFRADLVHVNLSDASPLFHLRTQDAHACPDVVTLQSALLQSSVNTENLTASILKKAARVVAVSRASAANIAKFSDTELSEIDIVPPGIPAEAFAPSSDVDLSGEPVIVFLGRLVPEKGADVAIEAFAQLKEKARLLLIGDGPERGRLEAMVRDLNVSDKVRFAGLTDDAERMQLLSTSFAMVVPSLHEELFGMVAVEGALSGLPVVASAKGGLQEIVEPGRTGYLCPPGDARAFAESLSALLSNPERARTMGMAGREKALGQYTIKHTIDSYEKIYADILNGQSG